MAATVVALLAESGLRLERFGWSRAALGPWTEAPPWGALRTLDGGDPRPLAGADAAWALAPGQPVVRYRLNGLGLRATREVAGRAAPGTCRVLAVGDAYTFGYGVTARAAYPARLERLLAARGVPAEVLNGGFPNLDVEQQARRLAALLPRLAPDVVLVSFDWWNVPLPRPAAAKAARWSGEWVIANLEEKTERAGRYVGLVHATFGAVRRSLSPAVFPPSGLARELEPLTLTPAALGERWQRTEAALAGMARLAAGSGARLAVVRTPLDLEVDPGRARLYRTGALPYASHGFVDGDWQAPAMARALHAFAARADVPLIDTTPAFRAGRGRRLFLDGDYHAAPAGHRVIARQAARWLTHAGACIRG